MRKLFMPVLAGAFLAVAGAAAMPETANAGSLSFGTHGNGWAVHYSDRDNHRARGHRHQTERAQNRRCEPVYRIQKHWTQYGWKRMRVHVGYDCGRITRRHGHGNGY